MHRHRALMGSAPALSRFDRALVSARSGLEGVLFVMAKEGKDEAHLGPGWSVAAMVLTLGQLFTFPLNSGASFPWCVAVAAGVVVHAPG